LLIGHRAASAPISIQQSEISIPMSLSAIILAAGKSTRMKSKRAKPLHDVCGRPMLAWILDACWAAGCTKAFVVVGYQKNEVIARFAGDKRVMFVEQTEQLGTGHAVKTASPHLQDVAGDVFVLCGDTPLIRAENLRSILQAHREDKSAMTLGTAVIDDPTGYGRIVRDDAGEFVSIVEQLDCTPEQVAIREVNPSFYVAQVEPLLSALGRLKNDNKKCEYYFTDVPGILRADGMKVAAVQVLTAEDIVAPNTRAQLMEADAVMQDRIQRTLREAGVSIPSPDNTYIEAGVTAGTDTAILPFSYVGAGSTIGADCTIGPFAVLPPNSIVPDGATVAGNVSPETASAIAERS
jgi:bifunctional UDP-N-acetylglucosamine pyrophosphorylase/glucosamine-1-phosphate N-acetyltransferase